MHTIPFIAFQIDPLDSLKVGSDTSLFLAAAFCKRGYQTFFYEPQNLVLCDTNKLRAAGTFAHVTYTSPQCSIEKGTPATFDLDGAAALFIRQDPPFNMAYVTNTYLLDLLTIPVFNSPTGIRTNSEKMTIFRFPDFIPPSMVVGSITEELDSFLDQFDQVILKPLYYFAGKFSRVLKTHPRDQAHEAVEEMLDTHQHVLIQRFLPAIHTHGDKRVFVIDGKPSYAMNRVPAPGNYLANLAAGGSGHPTTLTPKEHHITQTVGRYLKTQGILLAGLDLIQEHLVEINVTSPTGLITIEKLYGVNLAEEIVDLALGEKPKHKVAQL